MSTTGIETLRIDLWTDVTCPWCFIGKRRLDRAVAAYAEEHPEVRIEIDGHSFELTPAVPLDFSGTEVDFMVAYEGVPRDRAEATLAALTEVGAAEGIAFRFDEVRHVNTYRLHRLLHFADSKGTRHELQDRMAEAYFTAGAHLGDIDTLVRLAGECGIAEASVRQLVHDDDLLANAVDFDIERAQMLGITAVPYFLFNRKHAVPGALSEAQFIEVFERVRQLDRHSEPHEPLS